MLTFAEATWDEVQRLRAEIDERVRDAPDVCTAAQRFVDVLAQTFSTLALARVFIVTPFQTLPPGEQALATQFAVTAGRTAALAPNTPVLALVGSAGALPAWSARETSSGHRAIPFTDRQLVEGAPMIAALLASLRVDVENAETSGVQLRFLAGGLNARFYVPDARTAVDSRGRLIIAAQDFVQAHGIRSVFGMGGAYVGRQLAVAVMFTRELLGEAHVDRFPAFISSFKLETSPLMTQGRLFPR